MAANHGRCGLLALRICACDGPGFALTRAAFSPGICSPANPRGFVPGWPVLGFGSIPLPTRGSRSHVLLVLAKMEVRDWLSVGRPAARCTLDRFGWFLALRACAAKRELVHCSCPSVHPTRCRN